jgi:hypothetical protein
VRFGAIVCVTAWVTMAGTLGLAQRRAYAPYAGRWDLTVTAGGETYPSWIEVSDRDGVVTVVVVGRVGALHGSDNVRLEAVPVTTTPSLNGSAVQLGDRTVASQLAFTTLEAFDASDKKIPVRWTIESAGNKITGTQKRGDGVEGTIAGERAPVLKRKAPARWSAPAPLSPGTFDDFRLHVEFNCPNGAAGAILLRGRYALDVEYAETADNGSTHRMGAIDGFLAPDVAVPPAPGTWENFDVTLVGRTLTVERNGVLIIDNKQIPGITGGAVDAREGQPGPILLSHGKANGVEFRNVTVSTPAR